MRNLPKSPGLNQKRPQPWNKWPNRLSFLSLWLLTLVTLPNTLLAANYFLSLNEMQFVHSQEAKYIITPPQAIAEVIVSSQVGGAGELKLEWFTPQGVSYDAPEWPFSLSVGIIGAGRWRFGVSFVNPQTKKSQIESVLLGDWSVKLSYKEENQSQWTFFKEIPFRLYTNEPNRYGYHTYVDNQFWEEGFPFLADDHPSKTIFYTSEAKNGGEVKAGTYFDYYYQEPGIGVMLKWYYNMEVDNQTYRVYMGTTEPSWTNDSLYMGGNHIAFALGLSSIPIQAMVDNKLTGRWEIEVHVDDLADEQGFMLDDIVEFKLEDDILPVVTIETPDNQETDAELVPIAVHVEDDVAVVKMSWSSNQGDSGEITTENPREGLDDLLPLVLLEDGTNVITFTAFDQAENESEPATITVTKSDEVPSECFQVFVPGTDPIDAYTGSQVLQHELLSVSGVLPISFTLGYDSKRLKTSSTGRGW